MGHKFSFCEGCETTRSCDNCLKLQNGVVEVVRCKDCEYSREKNEYEKAYLVDEILICTNCDATEDGWNAVFPEHFCACGKKRVANDG